jgi:hypothetical protein
MKKLFSIFFCGCLLCVATITTRAQTGGTQEKLFFTFARCFKQSIIFAVY